MTIPDNPLLDETTKGEVQRTVPKIESEEDIPFPAETTGTTNPVKRKPIDKKLGKTDNLTQFRFETGRTVLYMAMVVMGIMVVLDLVVSHYWDIESDMIESAFEAFKLITMTVLGYIFGSNNSDSTK